MGQGASRIGAGHMTFHHLGSSGLRKWCACFHRIGACIPAKMIVLMIQKPEHCY